MQDCTLQESNHTGGTRRPARPWGSPPALEKPRGDSVEKPISACIGEADFGNLSHHGQPVPSALQLLIIQHA